MVLRTVSAPTPSKAAPAVKLAVAEKHIWTPHEWACHIGKWRATFNGSLVTNVRHLGNGIKAEMRSITVGNYGDSSELH